MAFSTSVSLLSVNPISYSAPSLTYSTASVINNQWGGLVNKTFTASPDPDQFGVTGFTSNSSVGLSIGSSNGNVLTVAADDTWPSYNSIHRIVNTAWGNQVSTMTPSIKDSGGIVGTTSGSYTCDLTRSFTWIRAGFSSNAETTYSSTVSSSTLTLGLLLATYSGSNGIGTTAANCAVVENLTATATGTANTLRSVAVTTCGGNELNSALEVKAEHVSGATTWEIYLAQTLSNGSKNTFYAFNPSLVFIRLDPRTTVGTTSSVIRVTFRHPNSGNTYSQDITLNLTRT